MWLHDVSLLKQTQHTQELMRKIKISHIGLSDITTWLLIFSTCLLVATLPFGYTATHRLSIYIFLGTYLVDYIASSLYKRWEWKNSVKEYLFLCMILFFLLQFIFYPIETHLDFFHKICEDRLSFIAIGVIGIMGINKRLRVEHIAWTCVSVALIASLFLLFHIHGSPDGESIRTYLGTVRIEYFTSHMLFNLYINTAIIFSFYLLRRYKKPSIIAFLIVSIIVFLIIITLSDGRIGMLSGYFITALILTIKLWKRKHILVLFLIISIAAFSILILRHDKFSSFNIHNEPRFVIWNNTISEIEKHPMGMGASTAAYTIMENLKEMVQTGEFTDYTVIQAINENSIYGAHSHSQYLQTTLEYGPIGLLILLSIFILPAFIRNKELYTTTLVYSILYAIQPATDIFVSGMNLIGFLLILLVLVSNDMTPNNSKL